MAIMGRRQKAVAQGWGAVGNEREKKNKSKEMETEEVSDEDHKARIETLKKLGLIKEENN